MAGDCSTVRPACTYAASVFRRGWKMGIAFLEPPPRRRGDNFTKSVDFINSSVFTNSALFTKRSVFFFFFFFFFFFINSCVFFTKWWDFTKWWVFTKHGKSISEFTNPVKFAEYKSLCLN